MLEGECRTGKPLLGARHRRLEFLMAIALDDELVPRDVISIGARLLVERLSRCLQELIAAIVAGVIVDPFQTVDVDRGLCRLLRRILISASIRYARKFMGQ